MTVPLCPSHNREGKPCSLVAGHGTDHKGFGNCKFHGGNSPNGRKHAQRQEAEQAVVTYGLPREIDPHAALLEELHRTAGHVAWLAQLVGDLEQRQLVHGVTETIQHADGARTVKAKAAVSVWVELYRRERHHLAEVAKTCVAVGIAERQVKLAEQQAEQLVSVIRGILTDLGHDLDDERTRRVVRLRLVQGGEAA